MEQNDDAGFCGRDSCIFNAVNAHGGLVGLASDLIRTSNAALCNSLDCHLYYFEERVSQETHPNNGER
jgi:hypothetical protein